MPKNRTLKIVAGIAGSFTGLLGMIIFSVGNENNKRRDGDPNACCVVGDVSRIRNSDCGPSLDWQAGMSADEPERDGTWIIMINKSS
jgi:hypothetical protein